MPINSGMDVFTRVPWYVTVWEPGYYPLFPINKIPTRKKRGGLFWITLARAECCYKIPNVNRLERSELESPWGRSPFFVCAQATDWALPGAELLQSMADESVSGTFLIHSRWGHLIVLAFPDSTTTGGTPWERHFCAQRDALAVLRDCGVSGIARRHCVGCRRGPCTPASFWEHCCVPGAVQVPLHPGLMQLLCLGIAWHVDCVHVRFWLLGNCIIGLSQKNTPSV